MNKENNSNDFVKKHTNLGKKIFLSITAILIVLGISIFLLGHQYIKQSLKPLDAKNKTMVQIKIPLGASDKKIGSILQDKKIVKSGMVFNYYVNSHNYSNLKAGYYELSPSMSLSSIARKLTDGGSDQPLQGNYGRLLIREGDTINQIAKTVEERSKYSSDDFKALMKNKTYLNTLRDKYPQLLNSAFKSKNSKYILEGYLYPATYNSQNNVSLEQIVDKMVGKTNQEFKPYFNKIKKSSLSMNQAITLASIVEGEHVNAYDDHKIAGVLYNRINNKLPLAVKASILYAMEKSPNQKISKKDYNINSNYNLFKHEGFGPGPINNPTSQSLSAILTPKDMSSRYLTFKVNIKTKKVTYSDDYMSINRIINDANIMK